jgi:TPR repeat protein
LKKILIFIKIKSALQLGLTALLMLSGNNILRAEEGALAEAHRAQEAGEYAKAATLYLPLAKNGDATAQFHMGELYASGRVIQQDLQQTVQWYLAAAEQGHAQAQANLGELYAKGRGIPQNYKKSMYWFSMAAKQGNSSAQLRMGDMYTEGIGAPQDFKEANNWYQQSANQGNEVSQARLAEHYQSGLGIDQDSKEAIKWLNAAASNAADDEGRKKYLARRDEIAQGIATLNPDPTKQSKSAIETTQPVESASSVLPVASIQSPPVTETARQKTEPKDEQKEPIALVETRPIEQTKAEEKSKPIAEVNAERLSQIEAGKKILREIKARKLKVKREAKAAAMRLKDEQKAKELAAIKAKTKKTPEPKKSFLPPIANLHLTPKEVSPTNAASGVPEQKVKLGSDGRFFKQPK